MIALRTLQDARREELRADLRGYRNMVLWLLANALACWLMAVFIGGSALFSEVPYDGQPFIQVGYEREPVSWFVYHLSFWHGFSVFFSALFLPLFTALLIGEHAWKAWRARSRVHGRVDRLKEAL